ncbi:MULTISPECIES: DUF3570 domain-containing protein [Nitrosomonas]|uniref:Uncharacterized protein DUF3570 n=1 Tax=Nitrosomonas communis TaxID=44574 RepID=A0A5D3YLB0_9PROT|nr:MULTISPECIES: DUF3570 domain-containing protein [Nitrosomonas]TYP94583.1 uncharacterized protein DUF3570 [Nitrosomonas communis]UVS62266.1 DUF3570 domain-containing protein [Nitrosomonas sp. PLL12]
MKIGLNDPRLAGSTQYSAEELESSDLKAHSASSSNKTALQALTSAALVLPGLLLSSAHGANPSSDNVSFQYIRYEEGKRNLYNIHSNLKPITVDVVHGSGNFTFYDRVKFSFNYTQDTWSGATPVTTAPLVANGNRPILQNSPNGVVTVGASPFVNTRVLLDHNLNPLRLTPDAGQVVDSRNVLVLSSASPETRNQANFKLGYEWDEAALNVGGGFSLERDYESSYGNISGRFDFNQKLTSLKYGAAYTSSETSAILDPDLVPYLTTTAYANQIERRSGSDILRGDRQDWTANLGLTQVLGKNSLIDTNIGYTHSSGFMENPYKVMTVIFVNPNAISPDPNIPIIGDARALLEQRPNIRNQLALGSKFVQHISPLDAALHLNYQFSFDDWGIHAHTFEVDWVQPLGYGWTVTPRIRYYSQDSADFYNPFLISSQAFRSPAIDASGRQVWVNSDNPNQQFFRNGNGNFFDANGNPIDATELNLQPQLVSFDAAKLPKSFSSDHRLSGFGSLSGGVVVNKQFTKGIELEAAFEYYTRASALKLGGNGHSSFADFDFYVANAAIKVDMDTISTRMAKEARRNHADHDHSEQHQHAQHYVPASIMFGHMLDKPGELMVGYRFMYSRQTGDMLQGTHHASDQTIVNEGCGDVTLCRFAPKDMSMRMHMLDIMYAPTRWLNLMIMPQFMDMDMNLRELTGRPPPTPGVHEHTGIGGHTTGGVGDTILMSLYKLLDLPGHRVHAGLGVSAPTGKVDLELRRMFQADGGLIHFDMQLGSGTWDFMPNVTYTGENNRWYWGTQLYGVKRMESSNESGYRLGDIFQASTWGGYQLTHWLGASVRGAYTYRDKIHGDFNQFDARIGPMDFPANQGGHYWEIGIGVNASVPNGKFAGNHFAFEWVQPLHQDVNGFQLERKGGLSATWHYSF